MSGRRRKPAPLETVLGHAFADKGLLGQALTHASAGRTNYERLEFLGDRVLGLVIARMIYDAHADEAPGDLSKRLVYLVRRETLAEVARTIGLAPHLVLRGLQVDIESEAAENILADAMEAVIGALYLDGGLAAAEGFVRTQWAPLDAKLGRPSGDAKTWLQEWAQARHLPLPKYRVVEKIGPDHRPQFRVEVKVKGQPPAQAEHGAKRMAELLAARAMVDRLKAKDD